MHQISELYIYPIKSMAGILVKEATVTATGFKHDRRWMLIDENNRFISQREIPHMALMIPAMTDDGLCVSFKDRTLYIPFYKSSHRSLNRITVSVWDDTCMAEYVSLEADEWFSEITGVNCRLVYMPDDVERIVDQRYAHPHSITSFSDAYPFLLIGQPSLDDLNSRMDVPILMNRFRPNIVFSGGEPFAEDGMAHIHISGIDFFGVKLCARCPIPAINQENASRGKEPLKTLAKYRQKSNKIYFGQNLIHKGTGTITVGDMIEVLTYTKEERFLIPAV